jgi:hypothetical protein
MLRHCAIEAAGFGNMPRLVRANGPLRKSERTGPTVNLPPPTLSTARDRKQFGNPTGAAPDFGPQPGRTSPALGWSVLAVKPRGGGGRQGGTAARLLMKNHQKGCQNIIFEVMSEVQKYSDGISARTGI